MLLLKPVINSNREVTLLLGAGVTRNLGRPDAVASRAAGLRAAGPERAPAWLFRKMPEKAPPDSITNHAAASLEAVG